jgi:nucleoside-diphosphate-sugar epimerase
MGMLPDISKIKKLGWKPKHNTKQAIMKVGRHSATRAVAFEVMKK